MTHVLVCDDEAVIRRLLALIFEGMGFSVTESKDGQEALDLIEQFIPDLVVSDIEMPRLNGPDLLEAMRNRPSLSHIPFILTSVLPPPTRLFRFSNAVFLPKPFTTQSVEQTARQALNYREDRD